MTANIRLQEPVTCGNRRIYPVISEVTVTFATGIAASLIPLALIIEEDGEYTYALFEGDSILSVIEKMSGIPG
jgi:hypothetical protein